MINNPPPPSTYTYIRQSPQDKACEYIYSGRFPGESKGKRNGVEDDGDTFATSSASNFAVVALSTDVDNSDYTAANANILVRINKHQYRDTTGIQEVKLWLYLEVNSLKSQSQV